MARPSIYTDAIAAAICERIACGESLRAICRDEAMPGMTTVFAWLASPDRAPSFREQYALAREAQADALVDDVLEIADDGRNDWMERHGDEDAGWQANGEHIQRSKLRVDARKWMAGKLAPKKYGEKANVELTGKDGGAIEVNDVSNLDRAKALAALIAKAKAE